MSAGDTPRSGELPRYQPIHARACIDHLVSSFIEDDQRQVSVQQLIREACGAVGDRPIDAQQTLARVGLKIIREPEGLYVAVASRSGALAKVFNQTPWIGKRTGARRWHRALRQHPEIKPVKNSIRFPFGTSRAALIPLGIVDPTFDPETRRFRT